MVSPTAMVVFGACFIMLSRVGRGTQREHPTGVWNDPPAWARRLFAVRQGRIMIDDALVECIGIFWAAGGLALAVTGQTKESTAFFAVLTVGAVGFIVGGIVSFAIWFRREILGR
jgi:hypothetical protein